MRIILLSVAILAAAYTANAETQAERDELRASYFAGFSCSTVIRGQAMTIRYQKGGIGRIEFQEDDIAMKWRVKDDKFCRKIETSEEQCWDLGSEVSANEREEVQVALRKNCL